MNTELDLFKTGSSLGALRHNIDDTISNIKQVLNNRQMYKGQDFEVLEDKLILLKSAANTIDTLFSQLSEVADLQN